MRKVKINVTQRDIDSRDITFDTSICITCPVARAIRRHKGLERASMGYVRICIDGRPISMVPKSVSQWIWTFGFSNSDRSEAKPFSFTIEVPDGV